MAHGSGKESMLSVAVLFVRRGKMPRGLDNSYPAWGFLQRAGWYCVLPLKKRVVVVVVVVYVQEGQTSRHITRRLLSYGV